MTSKKFPSDILAQAIDTQTALGQIDSELSFGGVNAASLTTDIAQIRSLDHALSDLESRLRDIRATREAACQVAWDHVKRLRFGVKATFGDDSKQYEVIGGTRLSDRKPVRRTPADEQPDGSQNA